MSDTIREQAGEDELDKILRHFYNESAHIPLYGVDKTLYEETKAALQAWRDRHTKEARETSMLEWLDKQDILDVQKFFGAMIYRYFMQQTNATEVNIKLSNFSQRGDVLGDLNIKTTLTSNKAVIEDGGSDE